MTFTGLVSDSLELLLRRLVCNCSCAGSSGFSVPPTCFGSGRRRCAFIEMSLLADSSTATVVPWTCTFILMALA